MFLCLWSWKFLYCMNLLCLVKNTVYTDVISIMSPCVSLVMGSPSQILHLSLLLLASLSIYVSCISAMALGSPPLSIILNQLHIWQSLSHTDSSVKMLKFNPKYWRIFNFVNELVIAMYTIYNRNFMSFCTEIRAHRLETLLWCLWTRCPSM